MNYDITILTEDRYDQPENPTGYVNNILLEDRLLLEAFERKGLNVIRKSWSDPDFDWSSTKHAIFRTTWDYFHRFDEFKNWLKSTSKLCNFINPLETITWNMDKHYLKDLQERGINIPATEFIKKGEDVTLEELHEDLGWDHTVLKPTIAGTARHTYELWIDELNEHEVIFDELLSQEDLMIQQFMNNVVEKGEVSLVLIGGKYSHSVLKRAKQGDFRVQDDFGGTLHDYEPSEEEIKFAEKALSVCDPQPLYARVDMIWDNFGEPAIGELELIEPELWFRRHNDAADKLAEQVVQIYF